MQYLNQCLVSATCRGGRHPTASGHLLVPGTSGGSWAFQIDKALGDAAEIWHPQVGVSQEIWEGIVPSGHRVTSAGTNKRPVLFSFLVFSVCSWSGDFMVAGLGGLLPRQLLSCYQLLTTLRTETLLHWAGLLPLVGHMPLGILASFLALFQMRTVKQ